MFKFEKSDLSIVPTNLFEALTKNVMKILCLCQETTKTETEILYKINKIMEIYIKMFLKLDLVRHHIYPCGRQRAKADYCKQILEAFNFY